MNSSSNNSNLNNININRSGVTNIGGNSNDIAGLIATAAAVQRPGKLSRLLTLNSNFEPANSATRGRRISGQVASSVSSSINIGNSNSGVSPMSSSASSSLATPSSTIDSKVMLKSPDDLIHQSPTEGPGQSPQEKPQSTSNEDGDIEMIGSNSKNIGNDNSNNAAIASDNNGSSSSNSSGEKNNILKMLLNEDDDSLSTIDCKLGPEFHLGEKNEAEPKKSNALLKVNITQVNDDCFNLAKKF